MSEFPKIHIGETVTIGDHKLDPGAILNDVHIEQKYDLHLVTITLVTEELTIDKDSVPDMANISLEGDQND